MTTAPTDEALSAGSEAPTTDPAAGVAWRTVTVVDAARPSVETDVPDEGVRLDGGEGRVISMVVVYSGVDGGGEGAEPADVEPRPLVIWVKGLGGAVTGQEPPVVALAEAGYVVAAPNSPEVSGPNPSLSAYEEMPLDVSAVVDSLLDPADGVADDVADQIDAERIAVVGHSLGASAARAVVFHDCCRDERVDAAVAISGNARWRFGDTDFDYSGAPLLLVHGTNDQIAPIAGSRSILADAAPPAFLFEVDDADHFEPAYGSDPSVPPPVLNSIVIDFLDTFVAGTIQPEELEELARSNPLGTWTSATG